MSFAIGFFLLGIWAGALAGYAVGFFACITLILTTDFLDRAKYMFIPEDEDIYVEAT